MSEPANFLRVVDAYRALTGRAERTVSTYIFNSGSRIELIRGGADVGVRTLARAYQWLSDHWPPAHPWPPEIPRPARREEATAPEPSGRARGRPPGRAPAVCPDPAAKGGIPATK